MSEPESDVPGRARVAGGRSAWLWWVGLVVGAGALAGSVWVATSGSFTASGSAGLTPAAMNVAAGLVLLATFVVPLSATRLIGRGPWSWCRRHRTGALFVGGAVALAYALIVEALLVNQDGPDPLTVGIPLFVAFTGGLVALVVAGLLVAGRGVRWFSGLVRRGARRSKRREDARRRRLAPRSAEQQAKVDAFVTRPVWSALKMAAVWGGLMWLVSYQRVDRRTVFVLALASLVLGATVTVIALWTERRRARDLARIAADGGRVDVVAPEATETWWFSWGKGWPAAVATAFMAVEAIALFLHRLDVRPPRFSGLVALVLLSPAIRNRRRARDASATA